MAAGNKHVPDHVRSKLPVILELRLSGLRSLVGHFWNVSTMTKYVDHRSNSVICMHMHEDHVSISRVAELGVHASDMCVVEARQDRRGDCRQAGAECHYGVPSWGLIAQIVLWTDPLRSLTRPGATGWRLLIAGQSLSSGALELLGCNLHLRERRSRRRDHHRSRLHTSWTVRSRVTYGVHKELDIDKARKRQR